MDDLDDLLREAAEAERRSVRALGWALLLMLALAIAAGVSHG